MQTEFPTKDLEEYSWFTVFGTGPSCERKSEYYHYTNWSNLKFIRKDDCIDLRFTRADCFEDKEENKHIIPVLDEVCKDLLKKDCIDKVFYDSIRRYISDNESLINEFRKYYVFCFSANGDSAFLKGNYACRGGKDGVIIGMQGMALEDIRFCIDEEKEKSVDGIYLYDVIYNRSELHDGFSRIIQHLYEMRNQNAENLKAIKRTLTALMIYGLVYKSPSFAQEEESRMIVDLSKLTLPKDKYYLEDDQYLHIKLPKESLFNVIEVPYTEG